jgi:hypothetical protein
MTCDATHSLFNDSRSIAIVNKALSREIDLWSPDAPMAMRHHSYLENNTLSKRDFIFWLVRGFRFATDDDLTDIYGNVHSMEHPEVERSRTSSLVQEILA